MNPLKKRTRGLFVIRYFFMLNAVSAFYACMLFLSIELQLNFYRIWRLTGWEADSVTQLTAVLHIVGFFLLTILVYIFNRKWLQGRKAKYWSAILWLPYLFFFLFLFANLFPITNRGDQPAPVQGLIIIVQLITYPFYLSIIYFFTSVIETVPEDDSPI